MLFRIARTRLGARFVRWSFANATRLLPVERIHETELAIAFRHPAPSHEVHVVIVPKVSIRTLMDIGPEHDAVLREIFLSVQKIVAELSLEKAGYSVQLNGGTRQEVQQVHFHLIAGSPVEHGETFGG